MGGRGGGGYGMYSSTRIARTFIKKNDIVVVLSSFLSLVLFTI